MRALYEPEPETIALPNVLYALSDPTRLEVLAQLAREGERQCSTFALPIAKSTLSHHLKVLREAGITRTRMEGMQRFVSLRRAELELRFPGLLEAILAVLEREGMGQGPAPTGASTGA